MQTSSNVVGTPEELYGNGLSDHAPIVLSFGRKPRNSSNSLPKHVCKHPQFKLHVARFVEYCNLFQLPAHQQLGVYKVCMKEAGRYVRDAMQLEAKDENAAMRFLLDTISRAIWFNKVSVARKGLQNFSSCGGAFGNYQSYCYLKNRCSLQCFF